MAAENDFCCKVEMLVDLEESNTVVPVVATRKPVLERPTEEVFSFSSNFQKCPDYLISG